MKPDIQTIENALRQTMTNEQVQALLEPIKVLSSQRRYGLVWEEPTSGAYDAEGVEKVLQDHYPFLKEEKNKIIEKDLDKPNNLLIEGDNLHALQALQYTHKGRVDVIYIDPPYNTGNRDFVYNDRFVDAEDSWRHSSWLSFMNKRLRLARELMSDDGVIFISIDDNEMAQLKLLCDQVFGEQSFIGNLIWRCRTGSNDSGNNFSINHEYILIYEKKVGSVRFKGVEKDLSKYQNIDNDKNGPWVKDNPTAASGTKTSQFGIVNPYTEEVYFPPIGRYWAFGKKRVKEWTDSGKLVFPKEKNQNFYLKKYIHELKNKELPNSSTLFVDEERFYTSNGTKQMKEIFPEGSGFNYPKPTKLIKRIIKLLPNPNALILDFFAGSGTTGHAVMELNKEDGGNHQFILCTNNEVNEDKEIEQLVELGHVEAFSGRKRTKKHKAWVEEFNQFKESETYADFLNSDTYKDLGIARAVTYERLKRVINGYTTPKGKDVEGIANNLRYFTVELKKASQDEAFDSYRLIKDTVDIIRIKEDLYADERWELLDGIDVVHMEDENKSIRIVLDSDVLDEDVEAVLETFDKDGKEHKIYTSYKGHLEYGNVKRERLPEEILKAIRRKQENK